MTSIRHHTWMNATAPGWSWADPIWTLAGVRPAVKPPTYAPSTLGGSFNPPGTGTTYPTPANTVAGIGTQWANWVRYFTDQYALLGLTYDQWALCPYYLGGYDGGLHRPVFGDSADAVTGGGSAARLGPLKASSLAYGASQARTAFPALAAALAPLGLAGPSFLHDDNELGPSVLDVLRPWLGSESDNGWGPPMIYAVEPRAATEPLFDDRAFSTLWATRLRGDGLSAISLDTSIRIQDNPNRPAYLWFDDLAMRIRDRAHRDLIAAPARETFPSILVGNWGLSARARGTVAPWDYAWQSPEYTFITGLDYCTLDAYPIPDSALENGVAGIPAWLTALGLSDAGSDVANLRAISVARFKRKLDSVVASGALSIGRQLIVWMPTTDFAEPITGLSDGSYALTDSDIAEMGLYPLGRGFAVDYWHFVNDIGTTSDAAKAGLRALITTLNDAAPSAPTPSVDPTRYNARTQRMLERQRDRFGKPVTLIDVRKGELDANSGRRATTETPYTLLAVRRPLNQAFMPAGNDRRRVAAAEYMILASDLAAAGVAAKEGQLIQDDAGARYVVTRVDTESDRLAVVVRCSAG